LFQVLMKTGGFRHYIYTFLWHNVQVCVESYALTKIVRKSIFSKWEYFCQNCRIIRQFKNILILRKLGTIFCLFLKIFSWFLSVCVFFWKKVTSKWSSVDKGFYLPLEWGHGASLIVNQVRIAWVMLSQYILSHKAYCCIFTKCC